MSFSPAVYTPILGAIDQALDVEVIIVLVTDTGVWDASTVIVGNELGALFARIIQAGVYSAGYSGSIAGDGTDTLTIRIRKTGGWPASSALAFELVFATGTGGIGFYNVYGEPAFSTGAAAASLPTVAPRPRGPGGWGAGPWGATPWGAGLTLPEAAAEIQHCLNAFRHLLAQYQDSPKLKAVLCLMIDQLQDLELTGAQFLAFRSLDTAIGKQLDGLGQNLLVPRDGASEGFYRTLLKAKALVVSSTGTPEDLISILQEMIGATSLRIYESFPAGAIFDAGELPIDEAERMAKIARLALPTCVRAVLEYRPPGIPIFFGFADNLEAGPWAEWGEEIGGTGGWAEGTDGGRR